MRTPTRYFLLQVPGWVLAGIVLAALYHWLHIPLWVAWAGWALFVIKDFVLYPYLRPAYETKSPSGSEQLIGQVGTVTRALEPEGYIQLAGELWQARAVGPQPPIPAGTRVRVQGTEGLVLIVAPETRPRTASAK